MPCNAPGIIVGISGQGGCGAESGRKCRAGRRSERARARRCAVRDKGAGHFGILGSWRKPVARPHCPKLPGSFDGREMPSLATARQRSPIQRTSRHRRRYALTTSGKKGQADSLRAACRRQCRTGPASPIASCIRRGSTSAPRRQTAPSASAAQLRNPETGRLAAVALVGLQRAGLALVRRLLRIPRKKILGVLLNGC